MKGLRDIFKYIVFEGVDGSGKTTQINLLKTAFEKSGETVTVTKEPGGTEIGELLRDIFKNNREICVETRELLMQASRAEGIDKIVKPALDRGEIVISDRSLLTGMAYSQNDNFIDLIKLSEYSTKGLTPGLCINILIDYETFKDRVLTRCGSFDQREEIVNANFESCRDNLVIAAKELEIEIINIDGTQSVEIIHDQILNALTKYAIENS